ncbi:MAG: hypothetical protein RL477_734 [Pseudomonadota bacterium]|jgi:TRAP transporter TAXI family solute receptor
MNKITGFIAAVLLALGAGAVSAQTLGLGTTAGGANDAIGNSISQVVSSTSGMQMRPQKMSGTQQYIPLIDAGKLEFGLSNVMQYYMAVSGTGLSKGQSYKNMRLAATIMPFYNGIFVRANSGINTIADLKGKRLPSGYKSATLFETFMVEFLRSANLTRKDVTNVPVVSLPQSWDLFKSGKVDAAIAAVGAGALKEIKATVGDIKYLPITPNPKMLENLPRTRFDVLQPAPNLVGINVPTTIHTYDYVVFVSASVKDDVVYKVVKALHDNAAALRKSTPLWNTFEPAQIGRDQQLPYHPGAVKFFREKGLVK